MKTETVVLVLDMSGENITTVDFCSHCIGNHIWLGQLGWPGQSTQTEGEILYQYDLVSIQGKKCSNGVYQSQT